MLSDFVNLRPLYENPQRLQQTCMDRTELKGCCDVMDQFVQLPLCAYINTTLKGPNFEILRQRLQDNCYTSKEAWLNAVERLFINVKKAHKGEQKIDDVVEYLQTRLAKLCQTIPSPTCAGWFEQFVSVHKKMNDIIANGPPVTQPIFSKMMDQDPLVSNKTILRKALNFLASRGELVYIRQIVAKYINLKGKGKVKVDIAELPDECINLLVRLVKERYKAHRWAMPK